MALNSKSTRMCVLPTEQVTELVSVSFFSVLEVIPDTVCTVGRSAVTAHTKAKYEDGD